MLEMLKAVYNVLVCFASERLSVRFPHHPERYSHSQLIVHRELVVHDAQVRQVLLVLPQLRRSSTHG
jgi:hypothetical protein